MGLTSLLWHSFLWFVFPAYGGNTFREATSSASTKGGSNSTVARVNPVDRELVLAIAGACQKSTGTGSASVQCWPITFGMKPFQKISWRQLWISRRRIYGKWLLQPHWSSIKQCPEAGSWSFSVGPWCRSTWIHSQPVEPSTTGWGDSFLQVGMWFNLNRWTNRPSAIGLRFQLVEAAARVSANLKQLFIWVCTMPGRSCSGAMWWRPMSSGCSSLCSADGRPTLLQMLDASWSEELGSGRNLQPFTTCTRRSLQQSKHPVPQPLVHCRSIALTKWRLMKQGTMTLFFLMWCRPRRSHLSNQNSQKQRQVGSLMESQCLYLLPQLQMLLLKVVTWQTSSRTSRMWPTRSGFSKVQKSTSFVSSMMMGMEYLGAGTIASLNSREQKVLALRPCPTTRHAKGALVACHVVW